MYQKLVRDKIPERIKSHNENPVTRILKDAEYKQELEKKLLEECQEVIRAKGKEQIYEYADLLEVMEALMKLDSIKKKEILKRKEEKKQERGGFEKRIFLEDVIKKVEEDEV